MAGEWWRNAVVYEVYPRSFADANGDGEGDIQGLISRLPYLAELGVDALWVAPWYPSPMADGGYDVSDYCDIDQRFGTLADADELISKAHEFGIRIIIDIVPNHCSVEHPWFKAALTSAPGTPERERFMFRDGTGEHGELPPNNWISAFTGSAWERVVEADGTPGQWYLHTFAVQQPDFNWDNPEVIAEFDRIVRFWFERGVDGLRLDAVPAMVKVKGLPDYDYGPDGGFRSSDWTDNPHWDAPGVPRIISRWRKIADEFEGDRVLVTEAVVSSPARLAEYIKPDVSHTSFNFDFMRATWSAESMGSAIDESIEAHAGTGAPVTWVLSSHDETRHVTRYAPRNADTGELDIEVGRSRARAALLLMLALPGTVYLYQGEELGLANVDDLPDEVRQDPQFFRSGGAEKGRDGCRVPLPWGGERPPYGFNSTGVKPWLPQPRDWQEFTAEAQGSDPDSTFSLYKRALHLRRDELSGLEGDVNWLLPHHSVLLFERHPGFVCAVNLGENNFGLHGLGEVLLSSQPLTGPFLPPNSAAWLRR